MRLTAAASSSGKAPWRIFRHQNEARFKFLILRLLEHRNRYLCKKAWVDTSIMKRAHKAE